MLDIKGITCKYFCQTLFINVILTIVLYLFCSTRPLLPIIISMGYALFIEIVDIYVWQRVAKKSVEQLPSFFMGISGFRMLAGIAVMLIYYLIRGRESTLFFFVVFLIYYFVTVIHHTLFFTNTSMGKDKVHDKNIMKRRTNRIRTK